MSTSRRQQEKFVARKDWPGRPVDDDDVRDASTDFRDWFNVHERLAAFHAAEDVHEYVLKNPRRRWKVGQEEDGWNFGMRMVVGKMGAKKSIWVCRQAYKWYAKGYPVFSNATLLFGNRVTGAELYDIVALIPPNSFIFIDEAHSTFESRLSGTTGVMAFEGMTAGLRKKNCHMDFASALSQRISRGIRVDCEELIRPIKMEVALKTDRKYSNKTNPANFMMAWQHWGGYPFAEHDIIAPRMKQHGIGKPHHVRLAKGEGVRNAFLLTDSFDPLGIMEAQMYAGRQAMDDSRAEVKRDAQTQAVYDAIWTLSDRYGGQDDAWVGAGVIAETSLEKVSPQKTKTILEASFGHIPGATKEQVKGRAVFNAHVMANAMAEAGDE